MLYFFVLNLLFLLVFNIKRKNIDIEVLLALTVMILFSSLSYRNGYDYINYESWFNLIVDNNLQDIFYLAEKLKIEYGFLYVNFIISLISGNFWFFVLIFGLVTNYIYYKATKSINLNYLIFSVLFFCTVYFRLEMSTFRQGIAVSIVFYSFQYVLKKDFLKYLVLCIVAAQFHISAYLVIFMYPFLTKNFGFTTYIKIIVFSIFSLFLSLIVSKYNVLLSIFEYLSLINSSFSILKYKILYYLDSTASVVTFQRGGLIFALLFFAKYGVKTKLYNFAMNLLCIQLLINTTFAFLPNVFLIRVEYYFIWGWIILLSEYIYHSKKIILNMLFLFFFLNLKLALNFKNEKERMVYMPYESIIEAHFLDDKDNFRNRDFIENVLSK